MYFRVNLKMKNPTLCCCFTWVAFIEFTFTVSFLLIKKTWVGLFIGNSVHPSPSLAFPLSVAAGEEVESRTKFPKRGAWEDLNRGGLPVEGGYQERGGNLF